MSSWLPSPKMKSIILIVMITAFFSCSDDKPTEPSDNNNPINQNDIASATIGYDGGELNSGGLSVIVPEGCFQNPLELSISINQDYFLESGKDTSKTYVIKGLPSNFEKKIRIAIKYDHVSEDTSYITWATTTEDLFSNDSLYAFNFLETYDSSGYLVSHISNHIANSSNLYKHRSSSSEAINGILKIIPSVRLYHHNNISIFYPSSLYNEPEKVAERFDYFLNIFMKDFNFDLKYDNTKSFSNIYRNEKLESWSWPIYFYVVPQVNPSVRHIVVNPFQENKFQEKELHYIITENSFYVDYKLTYFSFIFELIDLIDHSYNLNRSKSHNNLLLAIKLWVETHLYPFSYQDPPEYLNGNSALNSFNGFSASDISIGLATILKYLEDYKEFDVGSLGQIFEDAHDKNINHYSNLFSKINDLLTNWFPDYFEKYISGDVFDVDKSFFLADPLGSNTWNIDSVDDTLGIFSYNAPDVSAKRVIIKLNHEFEDESAKLILDAYPSNASTNEGVATIVFSADDNNNLEHVITARAEPVEIPNLKTYYQNGIRKFLVVVVNCINDGENYTSTTPIDLVAKVKKDDFNRCTFYYQVSHSLHEITTDKDGNKEFEDYINDVGSGGTFEGEIVDGKFESSFEKDISGQTHTGSLNIVLSKDYSKIESFSFSYTINNNSVDVPTYLEGSITGGNLEKSYGFSGQVYHVEGNSTCSYITSSDNYSLSTYYSSGEFNTSWEVSSAGYSCTENSYIEVLFWKE